MGKSESQTQKQITNYDQPLAEIETVKSLLNESLFMLDHMSHQRKLTVYGEKKERIRSPYKKREYKFPDGFEEKGYITAYQLSDKLGVSGSHVSTLCKKGKIGFICIGQRYFFSPQHIKDYIESSSFTPQK